MPVRQGWRLVRLSLSVRSVELFFDLDFGAFLGLFACAALLSVFLGCWPFLELLVVY